MTWTYTGDPSDSEKDAVRFLIGDTVSTDPLITDEEIAWLLTERGGVYPAAIQACETIAAKFARLADTQVDDVRVNLSQRAKGYRELAQTLSSRQAISGAMPFAGGISQAQKETAEEDTDRVPPFFTREWATVTSPSAFGDDDR